MNSPMYPMNNPMIALVNAARNGGNPLQLMQQMAVQNPQIRQAVQMIQGKSPQQLEQIARNMAKESGTSIEAIVRQLGL